MKQIRTSFKMVGVIAVLALMAGCATTATFPQEKANMLVAAGFKTVTSMFAFSCGKVAVVAQPTINANRAMTPMMLNEIRICFIFVPC